MMRSHATDSINVPRKFSHLLITCLLFNHISLVKADDQAVMSYSPIKYKGKSQGQNAKRVTKPVVIPVESSDPEYAELPEVEELNHTASPIIQETHLDIYSDVSSVVSEDQLRDQNSIDFPSALRRTPGVQITRFNALGSFGGNQGGGVFIRGIGTSRPGSEIKTYLNGVPLYSGMWGHPLLDLLPVNGLKSITVYKSPQPQINGNNFASIDLETNRATEDGIHGSGRVSGGYYSTIVEQAEVNGKQGDLDFSIAEGYARSDGQRQNADSDLKNITGRIGWIIADNWAIESNFLYTNNSSNDPGDNRLPAPALIPEYKTEAGMVSVDLLHKHGSWSGSFLLYSNMGSGNWYNHANTISTDNRNTNTLTKFQTSGFRWKENIKPWIGGEILVGVDSDWTTGDVHDAAGLSMQGGRFDAPTFRVTAPYAAISHVFDMSDVWLLVPSAGIRLYNHSQYDMELAPHAGISLVSDRLTVFANASRGINYPGLETVVLSQYLKSLGDTWKTLSAEQMDHFEVGVKISPFDSTQINASLFNDRVKNRYVFGFPPVVSFPQFTNIGTYSMQGVEISLKQEINDAWAIFGGLTLLDPSIERLPYVPKRSATAGINFQIEDFNLTVDGQYQSQVYAFNRDRTVDTVNNEKVGAFAIVNARVGYSLPMLGKKGEVFVTAENIFNRDYQYVPGYPMPGRWGQLGLTASF